MIQRYQELQAHRAQQAQQLASCFSNTDEIRKGEISDRLANGWGSGEALKFTKTGKEIKEKFPAIEAALSTAKTTLIAEMTLLKTQIGFDPTDQYSDKKFNMLRYPYKMCDAPWDPVGRVYLEATDQNKWCSKYNDLCWNLLDVEKDLEAVKVMQSNLDDNKKYELTVGQLVALCFNA